MSDEIIYENHLERLKEIREMQVSEVESLGYVLTKYELEVIYPDGITCIDQLREYDEQCFEERKHPELIQMKINILPY